MVRQNFTATIVSHHGQNGPIIGLNFKDTRNWASLELLHSRKGFKVLLRRNVHFFFPTVSLKNVKYRCKLREITMNRVQLNIFCLNITLQKSQKLVRHCLVRKPRFRCIFTSAGLFCDVIQSTTFAWATEIHRVSEDSPCLISSDNESEQSFNLDDVACIHNSEVWNSSHGARSYPHVHWEWNIFDSIKMHVEVLISSYQNWN